MDKSRKQFEEWRLANNEFANMAILSNGEYAEVTTNCAWHAWTASRAAIELEMPEPFKLTKSSSTLTYYYQDEVDAVLSCAGIKVKE